MRQNGGFTLIEAIAFIAVLAIISTSILLVLNGVARSAPRVQHQSVALQAANKCAEWFLGQRYMSGYSSITCPSSVPTFCTVPTGYTISTTVNCVTLYGEGSSNYKTIDIAVGGLGQANLSLLIANY